MYCQTTNFHACIINEDDAMHFFVHTSTLTLQLSIKIINYIIYLVFNVG